MSPGALPQNLRGRNIYSKQIATSPHQALQKMTETTLLTHCTDSDFIFRLYIQSSWIQPYLCISQHYCPKNAEAREVKQSSSTNKGP